MKIVRTNTSDGITFNGLLSEPSIKSKKIIIHIPGMSGSVLLENYYQLMHDKYSENGFALLVGENRGTGSITEFATTSSSGIKVIGNAFEKFEDCIQDINAWVNYAEKLGYSEIWLQGHSLGTTKIIYYLNQINDDKIMGVILLSPADIYGLARDPIDIKDYEVMLPEAKKLKNEGKGNRLLSRRIWEAEYLSADTYLNFFNEGSNLAIFNYSDEKLGWKAINKIKVSVIALTGTKDDGVATVMEPHQAMEKLKAELINSPRVKTVVFEGAEHSFDGFEKQIVEEVVNFVNGQ